MPLAEAIMEEGHRILSVVPIAFHATTTDVEIGGHMIPKDTTVSANYNYFS